MITRERRDGRVARVMRTLKAKTPQHFTSKTKNVLHIVALNLHYR